MQNGKSKFKDEFFKRLIRYAVDTIRLAEQLKSHRELWRVIDQIVGSTSSVGANVIEAKASSSRREYIKYFEIALKSGNESKYWFLVLRESIPKTDPNQSEIQRLLAESIEIANILGSSILTLKKKA